MDTRDMVLQKWQSLAQRWEEIHPEMLHAERAIAEEDANVIRYGLQVPRIYKLKGFDNGWEVAYGAIKITYFGWGAEGKARQFARTLLEYPNEVDNINLLSAQAFVRSCVNWDEYASDENISIFVKTLMTMRPLTVSKIWSVFRSMVDNGEIRRIDDLE